MVKPFAPDLLKKRTDTSLTKTIDGINIKLIPTKSKVSVEIEGTDLGLYSNERSAMAAAATFIKHYKDIVSETHR
jgi:hypothetical protein